MFSISAIIVLVLGGGAVTTFASPIEGLASPNNEIMYIPVESSITPRTKTYTNVSSKVHTVKLSWGAGATNNYRVRYYNGEGVGVDRSTNSLSIDYSYTYYRNNLSEVTYNTKLDVTNGNTDTTSGWVKLTR